MQPAGHLTGPPWCPFAAGRGKENRSMFRSGNPTLNKPEFQPAQTWDDLSDIGGDQPQDIGGDESLVDALKADHMTTMGTATKTFFLIAIVAAVTAVGWGFALEPVALSGDYEGYEQMRLSGAGLAMLFVGLLGSLLTGLVCVFAPKTAPVTAPLTAIFEGGFVCGVSAMYASMFGAPVEIGTNTSAADGLNMALVLNAVFLTFSIAAALCGAYAFKIVRPGRLFYSITIVGTSGVCLFGLLAFGGSLLLGGDGVFGQMLAMYDPENGSLISIGFSLLVVGLASMNLVLDYDIINNGAKNKAPKYFEWYGAYAILVTLVWLYIELLRLLAKIQSRE